MSNKRQRQLAKRKFSRSEVKYRMNRSERLEKMERGYEIMINLVSRSINK